MNKISSFRDKYIFLSNFYLCDIEYESILYPSVEHAYQAAKTFDIDYKYIIAKAPTAAKAKKIGQIVPVREDWGAVKISIMKSLLQRKFKDSYLANKLLSTGDAILEEGNWWGDKFWGVDLAGEGNNHLGKLLMEIRNEIKII